MGGDNEAVRQNPFGAPIIRIGMTTQPGEKGGFLHHDVCPDDFGVATIIIFDASMLIKYSLPS